MSCSTGSAFFSGSPGECSFKPDGLAFFYLGGLLLNLSSLFSNLASLVGNLGPVFSLASLFVLPGHALFFGLFPGESPSNLTDCIAIDREFFSNLASQVSLPRIIPYGPPLLYMRGGGVTRVFPRFPR